MAAYDLTTLANVRSFIQKATGDTGQDSVINSLISRASMMIMRWTEREFAPATASATRRFRVRSGLLVDLAPYDLRTVSSVTLNPEGSPVALVANRDYVLEPVESPHGTYQMIRLSHDLSFTSDVQMNMGFSLLDVAGAWGFTAPPDEVEHACVVTVAMWLRREVQAFTQTFNLDEGRLERPEGLPSAVRAMLEPFRRRTSL